jgi:MFS family permease
MTRAWALVGLLWIAFCLNYIDRQVAFSIFPALRRELGFSAAELGWVGTVFIWSYSLALPFAGKLADRTDKRRMIAASLLLWSLAIWGSASAASVGSFLAWRAVMGLTEALYFPAAAGFIASIHTGPTRSRALNCSAAPSAAGTAAGAPTAPAGATASPPSPSSASSTPSSLASFCQKPLAPTAKAPRSAPCGLRSSPG